MDNSSYPQVTVDIQLTVTTPAKADGSRADDAELRLRAAPGRCAAPPASARPDLAGAADRERLGLRRVRADQRAARQRRGPDARHHRPGEQGTAAKAGRLGRAEGVGVGRQPGARLPGDRRGRRRKAGGARRPVTLRQGRRRRDGVRRAVRDRLHRLVRRRGREAAPAALRRAGGERRRLGRVPLDGGQLHQVRRPADGHGSARGLARARRAVRAAPGVHQRRLAGRGRRLDRRQGHVPGRRRRRPRVPAARQEGSGHVGVSAPGNRARRRRHRVSPAQRRPHDRPELADVPDLRRAATSRARRSARQPNSLARARRLARGIEDLVDDQVVIERRQA